MQHSQPEGSKKRRTALRGPTTYLSRLASVLAFAVTGLLFVTAAVQAQAIMRVGNDHGGSVAERITQINRIRATGTRVEIRDGYCQSACTMYLGLNNVCVGPSARFGFHGPAINARAGLAMMPDEFEYWSQLMANYYPPQLRGWFLSTARYEIFGIIDVSGAELIRLGIPECT